MNAAKAIINQQQLPREEKSMHPHEVNGVNASISLSLSPFLVLPTTRLLRAPKISASHSHSHSHPNLVKLPNPSSQLRSSLCHLSLSLTLTSSSLSSPKPLLLKKSTTLSPPIPLQYPISPNPRRPTSDPSSSTAGIHQDHCGTRHFDLFRKEVMSLEIRKSCEAVDQFKCLPDVELGEIPSLMDLMPQEGRPASNASIRGGETEAMQWLTKMATECQAQPHKKGNNNSKISPWLTMGCLSPRSMLDELKNSASRTFSAASNRKDGGSGPSYTAVNWWRHEFVWVDFFRFITKKYSSAKQHNAAARVPLGKHEQTLVEDLEPWE